MTESNKKSERGMDEPELRLAIDIHILDDEWQGHAEQAFQWASWASEKRLAVDDAKAKVELAELDLKHVDAQLDARIRAEPDLFGVAKVTETVVSNSILLQPEHLKTQAWCNKAKTKLRKAKADFDVAEAAVSALKDRKHALQDLVQLFLAGYTGAPQERRSRQMTDDEKRAVRGGGRRR